MRLPDRSGGAHQRHQARFRGRVVVGLSRRGDEIEVEVISSAAVAVPGAPGAGAVGAGAAGSGTSGRGLLGMTERVSAYGGSLRTGPVPGGFVVRAVLPVPEEPGR